jgi:hypothetical protein
MKVSNWINSRAISDRNAISSRICPSILKQCDIVTNRQYELLTDEMNRFSIDFGLDPNSIDIEAIFNSFKEFSLQDELYQHSNKEPRMQLSFWTSRV